MRYVLIILSAAAPASAIVLGLAVDGGFGMPVGDYGEIVGASAVVDGRAVICLTPNLSLTAGAAYRIKHNPKDFEGADVASYDVIPILLGANYRFDYLPVMPYVGGGAAAAVSKATVPAAAGPEEYKATRLGAFAEGGMEYYLAENFGLDLRGRFIATLGGDAVTYKDAPVEADNYMAFDALVGLFFYP
ncbi:MAG: outer membrane beta-barrel protein [bacterium]